MAQLTDGQIAILSGIILMSRDRPDLIEPVKIDSIQEKLIGVLKNKIFEEVQNEQKTMKKLHVCLRFLQPIQILHRDHCVNVCYFRDCSPGIPLPALYNELFNKSNYISVNLPPTVQGVAELAESLVKAETCAQSAEPPQATEPKKSPNLTSSSGLESNGSTSENDDQSSLKEINSDSSGHASGLSLSVSQKRKQSTPTASGSTSPSQNRNHNMKELSPLGTPDKSLNQQSAQNIDFTGQQNNQFLEGYNPITNYQNIGQINQISQIQSDGSISDTNLPSSKFLKIEDLASTQSNQPVTGINNQIFEPFTSNNDLGVGNINNNFDYFSSPYPSNNFLSGNNFGNVQPNFAYNLNSEGDELGQFGQEGDNF